MKTREKDISRERDIEREASLTSVPGEWAIFTCDLHTSWSLLLPSPTTRQGWWRIRNPSVRIRSLPLFFPLLRPRFPGQVSLSLSLSLYFTTSSSSFRTFRRRRRRRISEILNTETNPRVGESSAFFEFCRRLVIARLNEVPFPKSTAKSLVSHSALLENSAHPEKIMSSKTCYT